MTTKPPPVLRPGGRGCPDLDPDWPGDNGQRRGPRVCVLYPACRCGKEDEVAAKKRSVSGGWTATNSKVEIQVPDPKASANAPEPINRERRLSEVMLLGLYRALLLLWLRGSDPLGMGDRIEREVRNRWKRP